MLVSQSTQVIKYLLLVKQTNLNDNYLIICFELLKRVKVRNISKLK